MRVCPKCGHVDDVCWRSSLKPGIDFTALSDFKNIHPELVERVSKEKFVEILPFVYHLTRGGNVERQAVMENPSYRQRWGIPTEAVSLKRKTYAAIIHAHKRRHKKHEQKKLLEITQ